MHVQQVQPQAVARRRLLARRDVRLLTYLLFGLVLPVIVWNAIMRPTIELPYWHNTVYTLFVATFASWYALDRLRQYAKARQLSYVVPVNLFAFGAMLGFIGLARIPYSISLFLLGMAATLATSYLVVAKTRHARRPQIVVPGGRVEELLLRPSFIAAPPLAELERQVAHGRIDGAIIADLHFDHAPEWERLFANAALKGIPVYHFRQIMELQTGQVRIDHLAENDLGSLIPNLPYMTAKRLFDIVSVIALSPLLLVLLTLTALAIRLDSKGSILFFQQRMGFRGKPFRMVKFRTMREREIVETADGRRDDAMTRDDDDRITRIGRFLRKTRLDELPQAWNVLGGDMSWIGPRPEAIELSEWYESEIPFYSYRHIVRPGITGWAQVNQGHVTDLNSVNAKLRYDFYYVKNISLWLDILIALKTVRVIFGGLGAR
ncbi:Undecaprenyl-phosphate galactosephosphotransferase [Altererythrobacter epoxidivorans]|uniref:Undecaprenyl-phosphate galactosephosphotransferase n=1 Tax=Altererythrobacter epoxidivorans TaxID=361183 RepID=A0A0M4MVT5_9SPHN|nr:exopolysaccharide biosynthesis polyprenyl glycosylphosphotransferase [Altererythrobacter epoxidivorans]ALE17870.1 Undecaprenyl-phosphate galactosephosphotransferase [Altererythrobacter epoxidivorans]